LKQTRNLADNLFGGLRVNLETLWHISAYVLCVCCQEIDVAGKKAIIIFVPVPQLRSYQKIQTRLVRELEKKFSGKHVVFIAQVRPNKKICLFRVTV